MHSLLFINLTICFSAPASRWLDAIGRGKHMMLQVWFPTLARFSVLFCDLPTWPQLASSSVPHKSSYTTPSIPRMYSAKIVCFLLSQRKFKALSHELSLLFPLFYHGFFHLNHATRCLLFEFSPNQFLRQGY